MKLHLFYSLQNIENYVDCNEEGSDSVSPYILQTLFHVSVLQSKSAGPFSHDSQLETVCRSNCLYSIKAYMAVEVTVYDMIT